MSVTTQSTTPATLPSGTKLALDVVGAAAAPATGDGMPYTKLDIGAAGASSPVTDANPMPVTNGAQLPTALAASGAMKTADVGTRAITGSYFVGTPLITGAASAQNLASIENPTGSGKVLYVKRIEVQGSVAAIATTQFLYRVGRTSALPSAGTVMTSQKHDTNDSALVAVVRQAPTATAATGDIWTGCPGVLITAAGQYVPAQLTFSAGDRESSDVVLRAGEALLVRADTNTTGWRHSVDFFWDEGT